MKALAGILLLGGLSFAQERITMVADWTAFPATDTTARLEVLYAVPRRLLTYTTRQDSFVALYRVELQVATREHELVAGQIRKQESVLSSFEQTRKLDATVTGTIDAQLPFGSYLVSLHLKDAQSANDADTTFPVQVDKSPIGGPRFGRAGGPAAGRSFSSKETLILYVELVNPGGRFDSLSLRLLDQDKSVARQSEKVEPRARFARTFEFPLASLPGGTYAVEVVAAGLHDRSSRQVRFTIRNPFYLMDRDFGAKVDELIYVATPQQMDSLRKAAPDKRKEAWDAFWHRRDPTPQTEENEAEDEYFRRIEYCNENFGRGDRGYRSDRARVYMKYGPPDEVESHPFDPSSQAYEVWYYYSTSGRFVFIDKDGFGVFVLVYPADFRL